MSVGGIDVDVVQKDIKNLHIGVYPPMGRVRVAAPTRMNDEQIRLAVVQRLAWIKRRREELLAADRQSEREMVSGETHYLWGTRYRLRVVERPGRPHLQIDKSRLLLYVSPGANREARLSALHQFQRDQLRDRIPELIKKWESVVDHDVARWSIRRMKTKWGSCNRETGHIWFNLELATKHPRCLEYIVVHEMAHLVERNHDERFAHLMDRLMPDWRTQREELIRAPLAHENWT